jgi:hypothetical protein
MKLLFTERFVTENRRRAKARGGLDGQTVNDGSSVSAFESPPIWQREVLLARVRLPLRANTRT